MGAPVDQLECYCTTATCGASMPAPGGPGRRNQASAPARPDHRRCSENDGYARRSESYERNVPSTMRSAERPQNAGMAAGSSRGPGCALRARATGRARAARRGRHRRVCSASGSGTQLDPSRRCGTSSVPGRRRGGGAGRSAAATSPGPACRSASVPAAASRPAPGGA
jgi:hypothetical protein